MDRIERIAIADPHLLRAPAALKLEDERCAGEPEPRERRARLAREPGKARPSSTRRLHVEHRRHRPERRERPVRVEGVLEAVQPETREPAVGLRLAAKRKRRVFEHRRVGRARPVRLLFRFRRYQHALSAQILGELRSKNQLSVADSLTENEGYDFQRVAVASDRVDGEPAIVLGPEMEVLAPRRPNPVERCLQRIIDQAVGVQDRDAAFLTELLEGTAKQTPSVRPRSSLLR